MTTIEAGKPYIIKWESGDNLVNPTFSGVTFNNTVRDVTSSDRKVKFKGTYSPISYTEENRSVLFLDYDSSMDASTLYYPDGSATITINAFRGYFQLSESLRAMIEESTVNEFRLNFGDEATSLNEELRIKNEELAGAWYTIDGRKFGSKPTQKGIYINNGWKVIVK